MFTGRTDAEAETHLKLRWYFDHLRQRADSFIGKDPDAGRDWGKRRRGRQRMRRLDGITDSMDMGLSELGDGQGGLVCCSPWGCKELDTTE